MVNKKLKVSVSNTFVQLTEGRSARDQPKQPPTKKETEDLGDHPAPGRREHTMERCGSGKPHVHIMLQFHAASEWREVDGFCFGAARPNA